MACAHTVKDEYLFCPECGTQQDRKICQCLQINSSKAKFCTRCGNELNETLVIQSVEKTKEPTGLSYNIEELANTAQNDPEAVCVIKNIKISQEDINAIFKRKPSDDGK